MQSKTKVCNTFKQNLRQRKGIHLIQKSERAQLQAFLHLLLSFAKKSYATLAASDAANMSEFSIIPRITAFGQWLEL